MSIQNWLASIEVLPDGSVWKRYNGRWWLVFPPAGIWAMMQGRAEGKGGATASN